MRRDNLFWGIALIVVGVLFFLQAQGIIKNVMAFIFPTLLISAGALLALGVLWKTDEFDAMVVQINEKRYNPRLWIGILMIFGGVLNVLQVLGILSGVGDIFWGVLFAIAGLIFFNILIRDRHNWWAAFPAFGLLGIAVASLLPEPLNAYGGLAFFAFMSIAFWWVYLRDNHNWWAIIPAGVLLTLGIISVVDGLLDMDSGGFFFLGLGITFLLVALLPSGGSRTWAYIPAAVLLVLGILIGTPALVLFEYVGPAALIVLGGLFLFRFFRNSAA